MKILLDTCALLWWTLDPEKLSETCFESLNQAESLWVSSISIWELGIKIKNKKLELPLSFENYVKKLQQLNWMYEWMLHPSFPNNIELRFKYNYIFHRRCHWGVPDKVILKNRHFA